MGSVIWNGVRSRKLSTGSQAIEVETPVTNARNRASGSAKRLSSRVTSNWRASVRSREKRIGLGTGPRCAHRRLPYRKTNANSPAARLKVILVTRDFTKTVSKPTDWNQNQSAARRIRVGEAR